jgi:futalosine hydrolase
VGPIVVTASTELELELVVRASGARELEDVAGRPVYGGKVADASVILAVTGIGKVNAAAATMALAARFSPALIVNTGCAGAYPESGLFVGDLALATSEILGDEGVLTSDGWEPLDLIGIPSLVVNGTPYFNEFPLCRQTAARAKALAVSRGISLRSGRFVTVSTCSGTAARGAELYRRFGGICENMEGAAVVQVALACGIPCLEVRGISNLVEDRDLSRWDISAAVCRAQQLVLAFLETAVPATP